MIPSLPGHGFSGKPTATGWDPIRIARAWAVLMKRLGYTRYVAQGGDWGNAVTEQMALQTPPGPDRHPHQHAGDRAGRHRQGARGRRAGAGRASRPTSSTPGTSSTSSTSTASATRRRWRTGRRRSTRSPTRRSAWPPGCSTTTRAATTLIARVFDGAAGGPDARRHPRQRHALLADQHGGLVGAALLGEQAGVLRAEGRHSCPTAVSAFPDEIYTRPAQLDREGLSQADPLQPAPEGRPLRRLGTADSSFTEELRTAFRPLRTA